MPFPNQLPLHFPPHIFEIVKALLSGYPLGGENRAFGEAAAGFRIVAQVDSIIVRLEHHFMHADDFALAEGGDFYRIANWHSLAHQPLNHDRGAGRRVFFVRMMPLEDLPPVLVVQGSGRAAGGIEEQIHSH